jgi:hypothetical protein
MVTFKAHSRGGFDYSFNNLEMLSSVKMVWNTITKPIFKERSRAFIGLKEFMDDGDVIQAGIYDKLYRIVKFEKMDPKGGNIYEIHRVDNASITEFDIDATKKGQKVKIKNRKSFQQMFNDFLIFDKKDGE